MKLLYDYQTFELQNHGGISRYFYELLTQLENAPETSYELPLLYSSNVYIRQHQQLSSALRGPADFYQNFIVKREFPGKFRLYSLTRKLFKKHFEKNKAAAIKKIKAGDYDLFHPTYYDPYFLPHLNSKPFVVNVYDMIHELFPHHFPSDDSTAKNKKVLCEKASTVLAISQNTKNDLIRLLGLPAEKIEVVHLATSMVPEMGKSLKPYSTPYFLFVGNRTAYKNFHFVVEALADFLIQKDMHLVCCGGGAFNEQEKSFIKKLGVYDRIVFQAANDASLANLYSHACAFIFPSLYEGFGIPVLEAFSCHCPCILSNGGSLPEIGADAAAYFDPTKKNELLTLANKCADDPDFRKELIEKGDRRNKDFSWKLTCEKTLKVYHKTLQQKK